MKTSLLFILLTLILTDPAKIGKINRVKEEAKKAYLAGDYEMAAAKYKYLTDSLAVTEEEVLLNLANAYFQLNDTTSAIGQYQSLTQSANNKIRSLAQQQLGVARNKQAKFEEALNHFKEAVKADPANDDARYNYELLKRKLDEQKKQEQQQKDQNKDQQQNEKQDQQKKEDQKKEQEKKDQEKKDQEKKDESGKPDQQKENEQKEQQQNQEQQSEKDQEKKDIPPSSEKLQQMKISPEAANKILEAMKNQEIQYLQQNKRKATEPKDKGKPDW